MWWLDSKRTTCYIKGAHSQKTNWPKSCGCHVLQPKWSKRSNERATIQKNPWCIICRSPWPMTKAACTNVTIKDELSRVHGPSTETSEGPNANERANILLSKKIQCINCHSPWPMRKAFTRASILCGSLQRAECSKTHQCYN